VGLALTLTEELHDGADFRAQTRQHPLLEYPYSARDSQDFFAEHLELALERGDLEHRLQHRLEAMHRLLEVRRGDGVIVGTFLRRPHEGPESHEITIADAEEVALRNVHAHFSLRERGERLDECGPLVSLAQVQFVNGDAVVAPDRVARAHQGAHRFQESTNQGLASRFEDGHAVCD